jgi:hypothetical protein
MDRFQQLVETLRVLARTNEPNRVALVEKAINEYLNDKAGIVRLSLERLCDAIDREEAGSIFVPKTTSAFRPASRTSTPSTAGKMLGSVPIPALQLSES